MKNWLYILGLVVLGLLYAPDSYSCVEHQAQETQSCDIHQKKEIEKEDHCDESNKMVDDSQGHHHCHTNAPCCCIHPIAAIAFVSIDDFNFELILHGFKETNLIRPIGRISSGYSSIFIPPKIA